MIYKGIAVSSGLGVAKCLILDDSDQLVFDTKSIEVCCVEEEKAKVTAAVEKAVLQLNTIKNRAQDKGAGDRVEIIEAQIMLMQDPMLINTMFGKIEQEKIIAARAVLQTVDEQAAVLESMEDAYFRERAQDARDIGRRLLNIILGIEEKDISYLTEDVILVGKVITPSQMAAADRERVMGIISETGGKTSHTAILAKNMEIPAVFGLSGISRNLCEGMSVAVNGTIGTIETEITKEREIELNRDIQKLLNIKAILKEMINKPTMTKEGKEISLCTNIMRPEDTLKVSELNADGVGLYRTEFLFMDRKSAPTEEEQFNAYRLVLEAAGGKPVTIRIMDIGGDKEIAYLNLPKEENPFIGYRAIRICLDDKALFKTQLRAILRASSYGKAMIMYPMISSLEEVRAANAILNEVKEELRNEGKVFDEKIPVGIMIEIPSAAVMSDILIKEADFFSIGTNDLTQYTLAVDRMNQKLSGLYNPFQPGVLRLIRRVIEAADEAGNGKFAAMCGELAADPYATILLLGMGLHEFSVNPSSLLKIRKLISLVDMNFAREVAHNAMTFSTASEIESYLHKITKDIMGEFLI